MAEPLCSQTIVQHCYSGEVEKLNSMYINIIIVSWDILLVECVSVIRCNVAIKKQKYKKCSRI